MSNFQVGDRVVYNYTQVATVRTYDTDADRLVVVVDLPGGSTDTIYGHISNSHLEHLVADRVTLPSVTAEGEAEGDQFTTATEQ